MLKSIAVKILSLIMPDPMKRMQKAIVSEYRRAIGLNSSGLMNDLKLPEGYGRGLPERVVEILMARLSHRSGARVLDVGHANAMKCHLEMIDDLRDMRLYGIDITQPVYDADKRYEKSYLEDITKTSFQDGSFDLIWCISALEHFGMDNTGYTKEFRSGEGMDVAAVIEMLRLLSLKGSMLITVPFGKYENHKWMRNYDEERWNSILDIIKGKADIIELYFHHDESHGWVKTNKESLANSGYYDQKNAGAAAIAAVFATKRGNSDCSQD